MSGSLFRVQVIEALRPGKRVHSSADWLVPANDPDEAMKKIMAVFDDPERGGTRPVYFGKPIRFGDGPFPFTHGTVSRENVAALLETS